MLYKRTWLLTRKTQQCCALLKCWDRNLSDEQRELHRLHRRCHLDLRKLLRAPLVALPVSLLLWALLLWVLHPLLSRLF
jgi:hypothetical protein